MNKLGFIGTGNLAGSLIKGLVQSRSGFDLYAFDLYWDKVTALAEKYPVTGCSFPEIVQEADILLLAVKPQDVPGLLLDLSGLKLENKLIIASVAGIGLAFYERILPGTSVVRVMPNTSSSVLQAVSGLARGRQVSDEQARAVEKIFSALGKYIWLPDNKINALTAVSGSGPAYFYLLTELMAQGGVMLGLSKEEADFLARETLIGAGKMAAEDPRSMQELRKAVTSPKGTTEAAINTFLEEGMVEAVYRGMEACLRRAREMEGEFTDAGPGGN